MDIQLLQAMLKKKEIIVEDIMKFYDLNIEQMIDLLLQYLKEILMEFEKEEQTEIPKYLFRILQKVDYLYDMFVDTGKVRLPNYRLYQELNEKLFSLSKFYRVTTDSSLDNKEQWYLNVYYYQDKSLIQHLLLNDYFLHEFEEDLTMIKEFLKSYFEIFSNGSHIEYQYFNDVLKLILNSLTNDNLLNQVVEELDHFVQQQLKIKDSNYRINELVQLCVQLKYQAVNPLHHYQIEFLQNQEVSHDVEVFTIDEENTGLREDALSVRVEGNNTYITMYITDPTDIFIQNDKFMDEAFSNWFIHQRDYILDYEILKQLFSLDKGKKRFVIAYELIFDEQNNLLRMNIYPTQICVSKNYSYTSIQEQTKWLKEQHPEIVRLYEITKTLHESNNFKKRYHKLKELKYFLEYNKRYQPESKYMVISEFKILLGSLLAKEFSDNKIPLIYRNNEAQVTNKDVAQIEEKCNQENEISSIRRKIESLNLHSYYSYENIGHNGLGVKQYTHITTPLRNYFSLINMIILKEIMIYGKTNEIAIYQELVERLTEIQYEKQHYRQKIYQLHNIKFGSQGE